MFGKRGTGKEKKGSREGKKEEGEGKEEKKQHILLLLVF